MNQEDGGTKGDELNERLGADALFDGSQAHLLRISASEDSPNGKDLTRRPPWTFEDYLEAKGFQADACIDTTHPDFYRLARNLWDGLNVIADCRTHDTPREFAENRLCDA